MANHIKLVSLESHLCRVCNETKPLSEFYKRDDKRYHNGEYYRDECKPCAKSNVKQYWDKRKHTPEHKEKARNWNIIRKYGINLDDAKAMLASQGGRCANKGCGSELNFEAQKGVRSKANIDHCHATGTIRGILCLTCNTALGLIEQKHRMSGLNDYLEKFNSNSRS